MKNYKIISFKAKNVHGLEAFEKEFTQDGDIIQITGKVGSGKSSCIDAIINTLRGGIEIKQGTDQGETELIIGDDDNRFKIKRKITEKSTSLDISTGEAYDLSINKPADFLKQLVPKDIAIFPDLIMGKSMRGIDRKRILCEALGIDTSVVDNKIDELKAERTQVGRDGRLYADRLAANPINDTIPAEEISVSNLLQEKDEIEKFNEEQQEKREKLSAQKIGYVIQKLEIEAGNKDFEYIRKKAIEYLKSLEAPLPERTTADVEERLLNCDAENARIRKNNEAREWLKNKEALAEKYTELGHQIKKLEADKASDIKGKVPLPGLSIGEEDIEYNDIPGSRLSDGEKMKIGCAIRKVQADNSKLKVVFVDNVSLLDIDTLNEMRKILGDFQIFEVHNQIVGDPINVITIEEGRIK